MPAAVQEGATGHAAAVTGSGRSSGMLRLTSLSVTWRFVFDIESRPHPLPPLPDREGAVAEGGGGEFGDCKCPEVYNIKH